jgi:serine/threonine protein kinase
MSQEDNAPILGSVIGGARIVESLSSGGMAHVYRGDRAGTRVVVKLARRDGGDPDQTSSSAWARRVAFATGSHGTHQGNPSEVLEAEIETLKGIDHPAFPRVLAVDSWRGRRVAVLDYFEGAPLRPLLTELRTEDGIRICAEVASVLAQLQRSGTLAFHGDLKPGNILVSRDGSWRLIDPTTRMWHRDDALSPEVTTTPRYYPRFVPDDIGALALTLYELFTDAPFGSRRTPELDSAVRLSSELEKHRRGAVALGFKESARLITTFVPLRLSVSGVALHLDDWISRALGLAMTI